jgi:hypothetical protein
MDRLSVSFATDEGERPERISGKPDERVSGHHEK